MKKKIISIRKILILLILFVIGSFGSVTLSKYVIEEFHSYYLNSKHFYFTSNRLKKNNAIYEVNNWSGVGSFEIPFTLLSVKNSLVYSNYDIPYKVTYDCPTGVACSFDKPTGTIFKNSPEHSDKVILTVSPSRVYTEGQRLQIGITAESTAPYKETIYATFIYIVGKSGITYEIEDEPNRPYLLLKITNAISYCTLTADYGDYHSGQALDNSIYRQMSDADKANCIGEQINLSFDPNVIVLDTTGNIVKHATLSNTTISGVSYVNALSFYIEPVSTMAIKFYKHNTANNYTYTGGANTPVITVTYAT